MATIPTDLECACSPRDIDLYFESRNVNGLETRMEAMRGILRGYGAEKFELSSELPSHPHLRLVPPSPEVMYERMAYQLATNNILTKHAGNPIERNRLLAELEDLVPIDGSGHAYLRGDSAA